MRDSLNMRCGSNFYLVSILHENEREEYILLIPGNGWAFLRIKDRPLFCPLYGPIWRCVIYHGNVS